MNQKIATWLGTVIIIIIAITAGVFVWKYEQGQQLPEQSVSVDQGFKDPVRVGKELSFESIVTTLHGDKNSFNTSFSGRSVVVALGSRPNILSNKGKSIDQNWLVANIKVSIKGIVAPWAPGSDVIYLNASEIRMVDPLPVSQKAQVDSPVIKNGTSDKQFFIDNIKMTLPRDWVVVKIENNAVYIKDTKYKTKYDVSLVLRGIQKYPFAGSGQDTASRFRDTAIKNGSIFEVGQGGAFDVTAVVTGGNMYELLWSVEGNQPIPASMDGPWQPDSSFTQENVWGMMKNTSIE